MFRQPGVQLHVEYCVKSSATLLEMAGAAATSEDALAQVRRALSSGAAFESLKKLVSIQGGDISYLDSPEKFPAAPIVRTVTADRAGYVHAIRARIVGEASVALDAGRITKSDAIDRRVGIVAPICLPEKNFWTIILQVLLMRI